jgi:hypothetical protein
MLASSDQKPFDPTSARAYASPDSLLDAEVNAMEPENRRSSVWEDFRAGRIGRRALLRGMMALGGGLTMSAAGAAAQTPSSSAQTGAPSGRMTGFSLRGAC